MHCGARLGAAFDLAVLGPAGRADTEGAEGASEPASLGKLLVWALSAGVAMVVHVLNTCGDR